MDGHYAAIVVSRTNIVRDRATEARREPNECTVGLDRAERGKYRWFVRCESAAGRASSATAAQR
jgi:hypothetical protein